MNPKLVSNQINPHFTFSDSFWAAKQIFSLNKKSDLNFQAYLQTPNYKLTNSARTALKIIIDTVQPDKSKKIGLPAFICAVVATPFLEAGYQIEWIDTDENGLISVADFKNKASKISLVVIPHIFGQRAPVEEIQAIAKKQNIFTVEDNAHRLELGRKITDAQILSFGREKVISCVSGGALLWPQNSPYAEKFQNYSLSEAETIWTIQHLLQPLIFSLALPWWNLGGKLIPWFFRKIKFLPLAVTPSEKSGHEDFPFAKLSPPLQQVLQHQWTASKPRQMHAKNIAQHWELILKNSFPQDEIIIPDNHFRVILKTDRAGEIKAQAKQHGFDLRDWEGVPISPEGVKLEKFGYQTGQCPRAEKFAQNYVTFPTNIRTHLSDVQRFGKIWQT